MDQEQSVKERKLKRLHVGGLPLIHAIATRMKLRNILYKYIPAHGNEAIPAVETLMLLVYNLVLGKDPLYELEEWVQSIDFTCMNIGISISNLMTIDLVEPLISSNGLIEPR